MRAWGSVKPVPGATINWGHPLAQGLEFVTLGSKVGGFRSDGVTPYASFGTQMGCIDGQGGPGFASSGGTRSQQGAFTGSARFVRNRLYLSPTGYTLAMSVVSSGTFAGFDADSDDGFSLGDLIGTQRVFQCRTDTFIPFNDSTFTTCSFNATITDGRLHLGVGSVDWTTSTNNVKTYTDGLLINTASLTNTHTAGVSGTDGRDIHFGNISADGTVFALMAWARVLHAGEVAWLNAEPYAFITPPGPKILYYDLGTGSTALSRSISDTAAGTDTLTRVLALPRNLADTANGTDTVTRVLALPRSLADTANGTDTPTSTSTKSRATADTANGTDALTRTLGLVRSLADTTNGTDTVARTLALVRAITDLAGGIDTAIIPQALKYLAGLVNPTQLRGVSNPTEQQGRG